ncbi:MULTISPECIES: hypothetical protein [Streptomyces]|uniref:Uncharacterized protein n=1 Tax=Streptomyces lienomycini TaxID=284035 RepID=A0ABV9X5P2_9ACTN|nr:MULTISPECIES: hypothetical protein [Streptomyces]
MEEGPLDELLALAASYAEGTHKSQLSNQIYHAIRHLDDDQRTEVLHLGALVVAAPPRMGKSISRRTPLRRHAGRANSAPIVAHPPSLPGDRRVTVHSSGGR